MSATVWIVILVPLALFGWLIGQAMPTPRDRQLQRLRTRARELDLQVALRHVPDPDPDAQSRVSSAGKVRDARLEVAAYSVPVRLGFGIDRRHAPSWRVQRMRHHADETYDEGLPPGWRLDRAELPLRAAVLADLAVLLARAPEGTASLEAGAREATLCWRERGEVDGIDVLATLLADVAAFQGALAEAEAGREEIGSEGS